jgi:hypothetical protein
MMISRSWARDPRVLIDLVVAAAVAVLSVVEVATTSAEPLPGDRPADALAYALVIVASISLVWRRRAPIVVLAIVTALLMTFWFRGHAALMSVLGLPTLYAVAAHADHRRRAWWAMTTASVALLVVACVSVLNRPDGLRSFKGSASRPSSPRRSPPGC